MEGNRRAVEGQERKFSLAMWSKNPFAPCSANKPLGLVDYRSIIDRIEVGDARHRRNCFFLRIANYASWCDSNSVLPFLESTTQSN